MLFLLSDTLFPPLFTWPPLIHLHFSAVTLFQEGLPPSLAYLNQSRPNQDLEP